MKQGLDSYCPESKRESGRWKSKYETSGRRRARGALWLSSTHSGWMLDFTLCIHTHKQSKMRERKHIGPTFLSKHFSWALHWKEVDSLHTQQNNQTFHGALFPSIPKDNKDSTRTLLLSMRKKQLYSQSPSEQIHFWINHPRTRWNCIVLGYFNFFKSITFW